MIPIIASVYLLIGYTLGLANAHRWLPTGAITIIMGSVCAATMLLFGDRP